MTGIGIDIGGTYTKIAAVRADGRLVRQTRLSTEPNEGKDAFIEKITEVVNDWKLELGKDLISLGIGAAGDIDPEKGVIRYSPNLNQWRGVDIVRPIKRLTGLPCVLENDANMAAWGAYSLELKKKYRNIITVTLGTGVGGGIVLGGKLFHGSTGSAGEIGHTKIVPDGELCNCGDRGCLEAYVGSYAISRRALQALKNAPKNSTLRKLSCNGKHIGSVCLTEAAEKGDRVAKRIWFETGEYLGRGLANAGLLFNPDCIVLTGGVSRAAAHFMEPLKRILYSQSIATPFKFMKVLVAKSADLGSLGAAMYGIEKITEDRG